MGLYMLNTIAVPTPNSAKFRNDRMEENSPLSPKYSTPK